MDYEPLLDPINKYAIALENHKEDTSSFFNSFGNDHENPDNEWVIDEWHEREYEHLDQTFNIEYQKLLASKTYFYGCTEEIYQKTYKIRLNNFISNYLDVCEDDFIKEELEKNIGYIISSKTKKQLNFSLNLRNKFLISKISNKEVPTIISNIPKYTEVFANNGFVLFNHILDEYVQKGRGRLTDIAYFYWVMFDDSFIHQRPFSFSEWYNNTYHEDLGKIKVLSRILHPLRKKNYADALEWFRTHDK
jgi:hypothetical protein